jgi:hypothetical protein
MCSMDFDYFLEGLSHEMELRQKIVHLQEYRNNGLSRLHRWEKDWFNLQSITEFYFIWRCHPRTVWLYYWQFLTCLYFWTDSKLQLQLVITERMILIVITGLVDLYSKSKMKILGWKFVRYNRISRYVQLYGRDRYAYTN